MTSFRRMFVGAMAFSLMAQTALAACIPFTEAGKHVGATTCVAGKVLKVGVSESGTHYLDFCEDYKDCPFTVVIFARDLRDVGDVRALEGKDIEIEGKIALYNGRPEIILKDPGQLRGEAAKLPPIPKDYDVERRGQFSAGRFSKPHKVKEPKKAKPKPPSEVNPNPDKP